jgi:hypothetical protein
MSTHSFHRPPPPCLHSFDRYALTCGRRTRLVRASAARRRAASSGRTKAEATAPAAATRATNIASNFRGRAYSLNYNDTIGPETRTDFYSAHAPAGPTKGGGRAWVGGWVGLARSATLAWPATDWASVHA